MSTAVSQPGKGPVYNCIDIEVDHRELAQIRVSKREDGTRLHRGTLLSSKPSMSLIRGMPGDVEMLSQIWKR